jgi:tetratricopeptide (TPR) repeat protein
VIGIGVDAPPQREGTTEMSAQTTLRIRQTTAGNGQHAIRLTLQRPDQPPLEGEATIEFALTNQEQEDLRWYMEDYLQRAASVEAVTVEQIETCMRERGEELYTKVLAANLDTQAIWFAVREQLADLRIEITTGIAETAAIPWELMRDPQSDSPIALRVQAFVRVQSNPNLNFVPVPPADEGRIRLLYVVCRPGGTGDVSLRAIANRLLQDLGGDLARFEITALRPPTFEQLQRALTDAKAAGRPYHIVHFDGHGVYEDLSNTVLADWLKTMSVLTLGGPRTGKHGYLLFEHPGSREKMRPVSGEELGKLLHDTGVPVLALNACQSAMHEATGGQEQKTAPKQPQSPMPGTTGHAVPNPQSPIQNVHDEVRAIGSLAQAVIDQGIPAVLGMRYSVYVVTAAQYIGQLYAALAKGRPFGEAASEGRKHLARNPDRWVGLEPRPLQDWFVPVVYEAMPIHLLPPKSPQGDFAKVAATSVAGGGDLDPVQTSPILRRYVPDTGFIGRDETLLLLDRGFDSRPVVLLDAYAGQGKSATAVEFARWYAMTGGLGPQPVVLLTSFEQPVDLDDALNQVGQLFGPLLQANGIEWHSLNQPGARRSLVVQLLRQIPVLWIWDNVEPVAGFPAGTESQWTQAEQAELADFLKQISLDRATQAKILLTSRRDEAAWLAGIPHRVAMPRMSRPDAAALALEIGRERGLARGEVAGWGPLLDYCGGNPLTLRVIAGQAVRMGLSSEKQIAAFIQQLREGERPIEDADAGQGRDRSLAASLDYGFRSAFRPDELPVIALLHLFQSTVDVDALAWMGSEGNDYALPEVKGKTKEQLTGLLDRAAEVGLLTPLTDHASRITGYYTIHPALPWYLRQLFDGHYDGAAGHSTAEAALRAWVEAIGELGNHYFWQYEGGNRSVIQPLALEEANLLHARRAARRQGWWDPVIFAMQGLRVLYDYQGRTAEWARLVAEIAADYCTPEDGPIPGREEDYSLVMEYRVRLARDYIRDLPAAARLQEKRVAWNRRQAAPALALPAGAPLDADQRNRIRSLGTSVFALGQILREQGSPDCVATYIEGVGYAQRVEDTAGEAICQFNLGHAYKDLHAIRDLDAAEAAYRRSLELTPPSDKNSCLFQIGMVHHERFNEALGRGEPDETALRHAQAAEQHYLQALSLCPPSAVADLGPIHNQLGQIYRQVGQTEPAREHYERAAQYFEQSSNRYHAGGVRYNLALMYRDAAGRESAPARRDLLRRAAAYAAASLRDYKSYQGRAADREAKARRLIEIIARELGE